MAKEDKKIDTIGKNKKKMKEKAAPKKNDSKIITGLIMVIAILLLIIIALFSRANKSATEEVVEKNTCFEDNQDWINEHCECIDYEGGRVFCPNGYERNETFCKNGSRITSQLQACSKYKCEFEVES